MLADRSGGVIVNADSAQVYRDLAVLSARPSAEETERADHRLYGFRDGTDPCSAAEWAALAGAQIDAAHAQDRLPILVGGTGLYLRTLLDGIAPIPVIDAEVRERVRSATPQDNRAALERVDQEGAARLHPADASRTARALEVVLSTGRSIGQWQQSRSGGIADRIALRPVVLLPERARLYRRCDERFAAMLDSGAVEEVAALLGRGIDAKLPVMRAIGVREVGALLRGEATREETLAAGAQATRNYAKRQVTWFAHQPPADWPRFTAQVEENAAALLPSLEA